MHRKIRFLFLALAVIFIVSCKKQPSSVNIELLNSTSGQKIIAPGLGTIGIISDQQVFVYFMNESNLWILDKVSQFQIPEKNQGIISLGMGIIGVIDDGVMYFYYMDAENKWVKDRDVMFVVPEKYKRISCMRMPWEIGMLAIEEEKGVVTFYYLNENAQWIKDETAAFVLPRGVNEYIMLGGLEIGIISDNKLGLYQLNEEGAWQFLEEMVLTLPEEYEAVLAFEPGTIAVLKNNLLQFYESDNFNNTWVYDNKMDFNLQTNQ